MARVVCQVLAGSDRLTLLWSEGAATFSPYVIEGSALADLHRLSQLAHQQLAQLTAGAGDAVAMARGSFALAQTGHALYRSLFQLDQQGETPGQEVRNWLDGLALQAAVERLEIVGDCFTVPWAAVYDQPPDQAAFASASADGACLKSFWGRRFPLMGGRRMQWLRGRQLPEKPAVVLAIDPGMRGGLPPEEQKRLNDFQAGHDVIVVPSSANLAKIFETQEVDLLYVCGPAEGNAVRLGEQRLTADSLAGIVFGESNDEDAPSGQTLVFLNAVAGGGETGNLLAVFERFSAVGLIGPIQPLPAQAANCCGLDLLGQIIAGGQTVADALASLRQRYPVAGSLFFASCPGDVQTGPDEDLPSAAEPLPLPDEPYQPLAFLDETTVPFLVGREFDTIQLAGLVDENAVRLVLVHGAPGVGRASLLHAGLTPYLEQQAVGYRFLRQRGEDAQVEDERDYSLLSIRASSDLAGQMAMGLLEFCSRPYSYVTPAGKNVTVDLPGILDRAVEGGDSADPLEADELRVALRDEPQLLSNVLTAITSQLPFELTVLIEQGEEMFSLADKHEMSRDARAALAMLHATLASPARAKLIVSMRTAYLGRILDALLQTPDDARAVRAFQVRELSEDELVEVLLSPTSKEPLPGTDEAPQDKYRFQYEQAVAEQIAKEAPRQARAYQTSALALVHVIGSMIYDRVRARDDKVARASDLKAIGGSEKALGNYFAALVKKTASASDRKALKAILQKLFVRQPDGSVTRDLVLQDDFKSGWNRAVPLETMVTRASGAGIRLFDVHYLNVGGKEGAFVSLSHDALAPAAALQSDEAVKRKYGWSRFFDAVWIGGPILILLVVFGWTRIRALSEELKTVAEINDKAAKEVEFNHDLLRSMEWPAYLGQLHAAEKAIVAGDLTRARQALLSISPNKLEPDIRGFDWYYLWHKMHQDQTTIVNNGRAVNAVALTPDGLTVATTSDDGAVRLWDAATGRLLRAFELKQKGKDKATVGRCVAFSADGGLLAAAGDDGVVRLWQVRRSGAGYPFNAAALTAALLHHHGGAVASLGHFGIRGFGEEEYKDHAELSDHKDTVLALAFAPDGKKLAASSKDGTILVWELSEKEPKVLPALKEHTKPVRALAYAPDGKLLASGGDDQKVCVWGTGKDAKPTVLTGHPGEVAAVAWSPDGKTLASGGGKNATMLETGFIQLWDAPKWQEHKKAPVFATAPVAGLAFTGQGKTLVVASQSNNAQFLDVASGQEQFALRGHLGWVTSLAVARGGDIVATGSVDGRAKIWMPSAMKTRDSIKASSEPVCSVVFSPDDRWLATGTGDGHVKLWHTASAEPFKTLEEKHTGAVLALAWSPNGKWLISGGADGKLFLWDMDPKSEKFGKVLDTVADAHAKALTCLAWGIEGVKQNMQGTLISVPHEKVFYSGSLDGSVKQWTVEGDKLRKGKEIANMGSGVLCLVHLPESQKIVATGHEDGKVRLSDYETGKPAMGLKTNVLTGHTGPVTGIVFKVYEEEQQKTSARLITASADQTTKYWGYPGGEASLTVRGHGGPLTCLTLGPPGDDSLVTGSTDTTAKLWNPRGGQERWTFNPTGSAVRAVAVSNDSYTIVVGHQDGTVKIYRAGKAGTVIE